MKIAVVGSGIAGMTTAHLLAEQRHDVHLYESSYRLGGHTATVDVEDADGKRLAIDTGFIVFNNRTYPLFTSLLDKLAIGRQPTEMSFSVSDRTTGIEYAGSNLDSLFAQRGNIVSPRFWTLVRDILRFNREVEADLARDPTLAAATLGEYLHMYKYSAMFRELYLIPMGAAIWSSNHDALDGFPLGFFVKFFRNHGLLQIRNRPQWYVIPGGSRSYIQPLTESVLGGLRLASPVKHIQRNVVHEGKVQVCVTTQHQHAYYDQVVLACHSDQALRLLSDPTGSEREILGAIPYTRNEVVLHTDESLLPQNRRTWSAWNVSLGRSGLEKPALTYNMNILQGLKSSQTWCVTLNETSLIREECIRSVAEFEHPLFTMAGIAAQQRWSEINGDNGTWYAGAWWRNGFHEDGVWSAHRVASALHHVTCNELSAEYA